jgi:methionyl-tRNA formyltransferase
MVRDSRSDSVGSAKRQIALFLMTSKGLAVLEAIVSRFGAGAVSRVVGARDLAVETDYFDEISAFAATHGIAFFERSAAPPLEAGEPCLAIGWRWLIEHADSLIVIHDSLLPRYRGFAPLVSCLVNGETKIGATALLASERFDEGDIFAQAAIEIAYPIRVAAAIEALASVYVGIAIELVEKIRRGVVLDRRPQDHAQASYSLWRDADDYRVDWSGHSARIRRFVDAVGYPYLGASAVVDGRLVRILEVEELAEIKIENRVAGKVMFVENGLPTVVCGQGLLRLLRVVDDETRASLLPLKKFRTRFC